MECLYDEMDEVNMVLPISLVSVSVLKFASGGSATNGATPNSLLPNIENCDNKQFK